MEVGSEVYSMALSLQLQKIVSSPLTQELRLSPAAPMAAAASLESMIPFKTTNWFQGSDSSSSSRGGGGAGNDWNSSSDVINASMHQESLFGGGASIPADYHDVMLSLQPLAFADAFSDYPSNASDSFYSHANSSLSLSLPFPASPSSPSGSSSSAALQDLELYYRHSTTMNIVYCVAYCIVFIVGLIGNSFVIAVVLRAPRMRTVTNYFIVNLALADILVIIFCLPATLMSNIFVPWVLGWLMCKTVPYIQGVSVAASVYSLIAVSLDRFLAIWWPLKLQITKRRARLMILCIWIIAIVSTIPWALFFDLVEAFEDVPDIKICVEVWPPGTNGTLYFILANLVACYILPMLLISLCYILIWIKVWRRSIPGDTRDAQMDRMQQKSKVKVVKMLVAVVILFVLSWLPLYVIFARIKFGGPMNSEEEEIFQIATPIAQWLGSSNSCINPVLYAFFNKKYRRGFAAIIKSRTCCGRLRYYESVAIASSSSTRKSSHYHNNQQQGSTRKAQYSPSIKAADAVSYIYATEGSTSNGNANFKKVIAKQDSSLSRQMLLKQQDSLVSRQSAESSVSYIESRRRGFMCKQKSSLSSQESVVSFAEPPTTPRRHILVKQDSVISFADQRRGILTKQDSVFTYPTTRTGSGEGPFPYHVSILKKSDSQCSSPRKTIEFIE